jgi:class 3 adenylate cyclase
MTIKKLHLLIGIIVFIVSGLWGESCFSSKKNEIFYIDLENYPLYIKKGFDREEVSRSPLLNKGNWLILPSSIDSLGTVRLPDLNLPGIPKQKFLSPKGLPEQEFTFAILFELREHELAPVRKDNSFIPGLFLEGLGDNWEIYLNGRLIRSEMHLDENGRIKSHRNYQHIFMPLDRSLFNAGENLLYFRVVGDPSNQMTGFIYNDSYYIGDYELIRRENDETLVLILIGVYLFMGIYHLFLFLLRWQEKQNLFYGLFSLTLGLYFLSRTYSIYDFIPDRGFLLKVEYFTLFMVIPSGALFMEHFCLKRSLILTRALSIVSLILASVMPFCPQSFASDLIIIWQFLAMAIIIYLIGDISYMHYTSYRELKKHSQEQQKNLSPLCLVFKVVFGAPIGNLTLGSIIVISSALYDIINSLYLRYNVSVTQFGFLVFTVGTAMLMARRTAFLHNQKERIITRANKGMNAKLVECIVVQDRDPSEIPSLNTKNAIMFTDIRNFSRISEHMPSQILTNFLNALYEVLAQPVFQLQDQGYVAYTDKFMGDGTMNVFTDPEIAVETAIKIRSQLALFNESPRSFFRNAGDSMKIDVGTGIAYGPLTMGVMGHSRRMDYTAIGNTVNLASRLENLTKVYHVSILINDALYNAVNASKFNLRLIDRIRAKGMERPVEIYEEFSSNSKTIRDLKNELAPKYRELQEMYFSGRNWIGAIALAEELCTYADSVARKYGLGIDSPPDFIPRLYATRMKSLMRTPELMAFWDGIYRFSAS